MFQLNDNKKQNNKREDWQSDAFINVYLPTASGGKKKVGTIGLKMNKTADRQLMEHLNNGGSLEEMAKAFQFEYRLNEENEGDKLVFAPTAQSA